MSTLLGYAKRRTTRAHCNRKARNGASVLDGLCPGAQHHPAGLFQQSELLRPYIVQVEPAAAAEPDVNRMHLAEIRRNTSQIEQVDVHRRNGVAGAVAPC